VGRGVRCPQLTQRQVVLGGWPSRAARVAALCAGVVLCAAAAAAATAAGVGVCPPLLVECQVRLQDHLCVVWLCPWRRPQLHGRACTSDGRGVVCSGS
jgi:hypothetical protein